VSKSQILRYLKIKGLRYRIDCTNLDPSYTRNKIRLRLLPYLRRNYNPRIDDIIQNSSKYLRQCADYIQHEINRITDLAVKKLDNGFSITLTEYVKLHPALRDLLMRNLLESLFGISVNDELLAHVRSLALQKGMYRIILPDSITGFLEYETLKFTREPSRKWKALVHEVPVPSNTIIPEWNISFETSFLKPKDLPKSFDITKREPMGRIWRRIASGGETISITEYVDADLISTDRLILRPRKPGDRYRPLGKGGSCTIKKLLIDEKVPISIRERIPIIAASGKIIYVPGYRISESVKITENSINIMKLSMTIFPL